MNGSKLRRWLPPALWAVMIFALSSLPDLTPEYQIFPHADKVAHLFIYAPFGWLLAKAMSDRAGAESTHPVLWPGLLGALYGITDEVHQRFVPGRHMDFADWLVDALAAVLGAWLFHRQQTRRRSEPK